jgi:hypothetical protein
MKNDKGGAISGIVKARQQGKDCKKGLPAFGGWPELPRWRLIPIRSSKFVIYSLSLSL